MGEVPDECVFELVMLMRCWRDAKAAGDCGWIEAPERAFGAMRTLINTGHVERSAEGLYRPTTKAFEAERAGVIAGVREREGAE